METYEFYERRLTVMDRGGAAIFCRLLFTGARTSSLSGDLGAPWRDEQPLLEFYASDEEGVAGEPGLFLDSCLAASGIPWWRLDGEGAMALQGGAEPHILAPVVAEQVSVWALEQIAMYPLSVRPEPGPARRTRLSSLAEHARHALERRAILPL